MSEHLDPERAQMDLTNILTVVRKNLRDIKKCGKNERVKELAKNYAHQTFQIARQARGIYLEQANDDILKAHPNLLRACKSVLQDLKAEYKRTNNDNHLRRIELLETAIRYTNTMSDKTSCS